MTSRADEDSSYGTNGFPMTLSDVVRLNSQHNRKNFSCGEPSLDNWLQRNATKAAKTDTAQTYVVHDEAGEVVGYYALCMYSLTPEDAAPVPAGRHEVPAVLLAKLAVDQRVQRSGVGEELLLDAFLVSVQAADVLGSQLLVVDALHETAAAYYARYGFKPFDSDPLKLYLPLKDVRATLHAAGLYEFSEQR